MTIILYTLVDKRPDFLPLQFASMTKYLQDSFELVVINNAVESIDRRKKISSICRDLGVRTLEVSRDRFSFTGGEPTFTINGNYRNPTLACAYPIQSFWQTMIEENRNSTFAIIDSDMFFFREISLLDQIGGSDGSIIPQFRGFRGPGNGFDVKYPWNAFAVFTPRRIPHLGALRWDPGYRRWSKVNGHAVDVGGRGHFWLEQNKPSFVSMAETEITAFERITSDVAEVQSHLNGNFSFSFSHQQSGEPLQALSGLDDGSALIEQLSVSGTHHGGVEHLLRRTAGIFSDLVLERRNYGQPSRIGFIHFDGYELDETPFIVHHKAGSGYLGMGEQYLAGKLSYISELIGVRG